MLGVFCCAVNTSFAQDEFQVIESRIIDYLKADVKINELKAAVKSNSSSLKEEGFWPSIDYSSTAETGWTPLIHLQRVKQFAIILNSENFAFADKERLASQINAALDYWLKQNPQSTNWFQQEIASPTAIGEILMLLNGKGVIPNALQDSLLKRMDSGNVLKAIGANKLDIAIHMIYRACVSRNKALMDSAVHQAFLPISFGGREGLQSDFSYRQHGPQLQIASYGQVFLHGTYKVASWLSATSYAIPPHKLKIIDDYLIDTFLRTIRGRYIDFNTEGRGIARNDVLDKIDITQNAGVKSLLSLAKKVNPKNSEAYNNVEQRVTQAKEASFNIKPSHTFFYKSDYTIHSRPTYSFNVRSVSKRTVRTEMGNRENLLGKFLPDGSTNIQRTGDEYFNIMPIWEWDKIPGVTSRDYLEDKKITIEWGERGLNSFIGGVSDRFYGASVYQLDYDEVTAKKAWFFFDNEVVCLGTDINSYAKEQITTTVNQAWLKGPVKAFADDKLMDVKNLNSKNVDWVWHDSIGYYFPNKGNIQIITDKQKGSWAKVNANRSDELVKGDVFKMWFKHGENPEKQEYAYIVKPQVSEQEMLNIKSDAIKILCNTQQIQAVQNTDLQMVQVFFYEAGTLKTSNFSITTNEPCVLLIKNIASEKPVLYVSDPTQKLSHLQVLFSSTLLKSTQPISITLPQGEHVGDTVNYQF
ncbi:polysaccharide lyase family 8 super-sandwich domain-containing protein [Pedobacter alpinus]|uniref:Polysaccharide lyase family 8 super-sandwich domain-containing protein n=2 Tax=Pedobacter alpinus TaxID=1590643 RepID=A0ABW5TU73_9SPHI